jgi:hypothetical protein
VPCCCASFAGATAVAAVATIAAVGVHIAAADVAVVDAVYDMLMLFMLNHFAATCHTKSVHISSAVQ